MGSLFDIREWNQNYSRLIKCCKSIWNYFQNFQTFHRNGLTIRWVTLKKSKDFIITSKTVTYMWHDQGKWVTCRKFQFQFYYTTFSKLENASFWCKPHNNWISGYWVMKDLTMLKTIWNEGIWTLFLPISQKQHLRHPTHSSWSWHICKQGTHSHTHE